MYQRKVVFATNEIYHIYNRSIAQEHIFTSLSHLSHIFEIIEYYQYSHIVRLSEFRKLTANAKQIYLYKTMQGNPLVEIYAFAFMPNHYHFILKQTEENGIKKFMSIIQNSYAKYCNTRYHRDGSMFQSPFQACWIETDEQFIHTSRYIHLNPVTSFIIPIQRLASYEFTSYSDYLNGNKKSWLNTKTLLSYFSTKEIYKIFVEDQVDYQRTLAKIRHLTLD